MWNKITCLRNKMERKTKANTEVHTRDTLSVAYVAFNVCRQRSGRALRSFTVWCHNVRSSAGWCWGSNAWQSRGSVPSARWLPSRIFPGIGRRRWAYSYIQHCTALEKRARGAVSVCCVLGDVLLTFWWQNLHITDRCTSVYSFVFCVAASEHFYHINLVDTWILKPQ